MPDILFGFPAAEGGHEQHLHGPGDGGLRGQSIS